jgi:hypothetical protein
LRILLVESAMPDDEPDIKKMLNRAANALEHIACSLVAIEMIQAGQDGGVYDDTLHAHRRFQHENCSACGTAAQNAPEAPPKIRTGASEGPLANVGGRKS